MMTFLVVFDDELEVVVCALDEADALDMSKTLQRQNGNSDVVVEIREVDVKK